MSKKLNKKLKRKQIIELVDMAMWACFRDPIGDPDRVHRYVRACCRKILEAEGYTIVHQIIDQG